MKPLNEIISEWRNYLFPPKVALRAAERQRDGIIEDGRLLSLPIKNDQMKVARYLDKRRARLARKHLPYPFSQYSRDLERYSEEGD